MGSAKILCSSAPDSIPTTPVVAAAMTKKTSRAPTRTLVLIPRTRIGFECSIDSTLRRKLVRDIFEIVSRLGRTKTNAVNQYVLNALYRVFQIWLPTKAI